MSTAWKTFDENTAAALKDRLDQGNVLVEDITRPLFADGDSVVIAPTLQKGAALVITARRKAKAGTVEEPVQFAPLIEEIAAPLASPGVPVEFAPSPVLAPGAPVVEPDPTGAHQDSEGTFGPTTWERVDEVDVPAAFTPLERATRSTDPEIWELPSQAPPQPLAGDVAPEHTPVVINPGWEEERYVATGFLGLENYVEDEEEIARTRRPWWKRIFTD